MKSVEKQFLQDTKDHKIEVLKNDGFYRHFKVSNNGSSVYHFDVITWPGYLSITGDMGCYTFSRIEDMLSFFNEDRINPGYWAEKIQAGINGGYKIAEEFHWDKFEKELRGSFDSWIDDCDLDETDRKCASESLDIAIANCEQDEYGAIAMLREWIPEDFGGFGDYDDFECVSGNVYSFNYLWCCYAIKWISNEFFKKIGSTVTLTQE